MTLACQAYQRGQQMTRMPRLTKDSIRRFVGQKNFTKGLQAIGNGALVDPAQQGMTLKAYCYGSLPEPYRVQISCDDTGITTAFCSCSADTVIKGKQACVQLATLLLSCYRQPETFTPMDDLEAILERQSKAQLLTLIKQLLQQQPEMEWELTMPPLSGYKSVPIDTDEYRHQVDTAFRHAGRAWDAVYGISSDLYTITATASHFAQKRDYANAAALYEVVARTTLSYYLSYHDEDGALGRVVQSCVEGLGTCLERVQGNTKIRQQILAAIFSVYRFDVDHGGFGLTQDIPPELLQASTVEEKSLIAQWVRTALAELQHNAQESVWRRQRYGGLLLALEADKLSNEAFLRIGQETKNIQAVVTRLLQLNRVDEAVQHRLATLKEELNAAGLF